MRPGLLSLYLLSMLTACTMAPPAPPLMEQTFLHLPKRVIATAPPHIIRQVLNETTSGEIVGSRLMQPEGIIRRWVHDRLQSQYQAGDNTAAQLDFIIRKAQVTAHHDAKNEKATAFPFNVPFNIPFLSAKKRTLKGVLQVIIRYRPPTPPIRVEKPQLIAEKPVEIAITAEAETSLYGAVSLNERDQAYFNLLHELGVLFDRQAIIQMEKYGFLR